MHTVQHTCMQSMNTDVASVQRGILGCLPFQSRFYLNFGNIAIFVKAFYFASHVEWFANPWPTQSTHEIQFLSSETFRKTIQNFQSTVKKNKLLCLNCSRQLQNTIFFAILKNDSKNWGCLYLSNFFCKELTMFFFVIMVWLISLVVSWIWIS